MSHRCAAYFDKSTKECKQSIEEHILKGVHFLEEMYLNRKFHQYLLRLSSLLDVPLNNKEVYNAMYASYIFHDIGKIDCSYQKSRTHFSGHEIFSAIWVYKHYSKLGLKVLVYPVIYAILLHHHNIVKKMHSKKEIHLCQKCLNYLVNLYSEKTSVNIIDYEHEITGSLEEILKELSKSDKELKFVRLGYSLLQLVHGCDNYSASFRGGQQTILSKEIIKVYESVKKLRLNFLPLSSF